MGKSRKLLWLNLMAWPVLFALGWWCGLRRAEADDAGGAGSGVLSGSISPGRDAGGGERGGQSSVRSPQPSSASLKSFRHGARAWLLEQTEGVAADSDPAAALRYSQRCLMLDEVSALELAGEIAAIRSSDDPAVKAAFKGLPLDDLLGTAVFRLSQLNPDAALDFLGAHQLHSGKLISYVFSNVAAENVHEADRFLRKVPETVLRDAMEPVAAELAATDPEDAVRLLGQYPQPQLDSERRKLVERIAEKNPRQAMEVAGGFVAAGRNSDVILAALRRWKVSDPEAARGWAAAYQGPGSEGLVENLEAEGRRR